MKDAEIHLPYFKQGDDLAHHLHHSATTEEALEAHAQQLEFAAGLLRKIREIVKGQRISIHADTHLIQVTGPDETIDKLIEAELADKAPWDEFEDDEAEAEGGGWDEIF